MSRREINALLEVFLDINYENKVKANESLYNYVNIFVTDLDTEIPFDFIFPEFLYEEEPAKCKKVLKELDNWINDSFTHHLSPLHQYVLFNIIETWINWKESDKHEALLDNKEIEGQEESIKEEENNICDDEWVEKHFDNLNLLRTKLPVIMNLTPMVDSSEH